MASLPQPADQVWDMTLERGAQPGAVSAETSYNHDDSPTAAASSEEPSVDPANEDFHIVTTNKDGSTTEVNEPSASEAVTEHN